MYLRVCGTLQEISAEALAKCASERRGRSASSALSSAWFGIRGVAAARTKPAFGAGAGVVEATFGGICVAPPVGALPSEWWTKDAGGNILGGAATEMIPTETGVVAGSCCAWVGCSTGAPRPNIPSSDMAASSASLSRGSPCEGVGGGA